MTLTKIVSLFLINETLKNIKFKYTSNNLYYLGKCEELDILFYLLSICFFRFVQITL